MKTICVYSKDCHDVIINIDYIVSIKKEYEQYGMGEYYIITMVNELIIVDSYNFKKVEKKFKEFGMYFENEKNNS